MPDLKSLISQMETAATKDEQSKAEFETNPIAMIEKVLGVDLPDDVVEKIIAAVKTKITADQVAGAASLLKKLF